MLRREKFVIGNWKMFGTRAGNEPLLERIREGVADLTGCRVGICAPFPYLAQLEQRLKNTSLFWGAEDLSERTQGAYTGDVSGEMLRDFGCQLVIVGHSERRALHEESDTLVGLKAKRALDAGLMPIICVGETLEDREAGRAHEIIGEQFDAVLDRISGSGLSKSVVAYEPIWAIGTGKTASPEDAQAIHRFLRDRMVDRFGETGEVVPLLYGGSVKPGNASELFAMPDIDGGLIGGASLVAEDFLAIVAAAASREVQR